MENKRLQKTGVAALLLSMLPLATFIPVLFQIALTDGVRSIWAGVNICSVLVGLTLSILCVKRRESRTIVSILSTIISSLWLVLMSSMILLALFLNFVP